MFKNIYKERKKMKMMDDKIRRKQLSMELF